MAANRSTTAWNRLAGLGLAAQAGLVAASIVVAAAIAAPVANALAGPIGVWAVAVAAGACLLGAVLALVTSALFPSPDAVMQRMALTMLSRTMIPLLLGVAVHFKSPTLADAGMIYYLLGF